MTSYKKKFQQPTWPHQPKIYELERKRGSFHRGVRKRRGTHGETGCLYTPHRSASLAMCSALPLLSQLQYSSRASHLTSIHTLRSSVTLLRDARSFWSTGRQQTGNMAITQRTHMVQFRESVCSSVVFSLVQQSVFVMSGGNWCKWLMVLNSLLLKNDLFCC